MKPALLVIDVQNLFFDNNPVTAQSLKDAIEVINTTLELFRKKNLPLFCIQHIDLEDNLVPGEPGFDLPESLKILPADPHIHKTYGNAFNKTPLAEKLHHLGVDTVFITGYCAEHCVLSTIRGARDLDFMPILVRGAIASGSLENIRFVESIHDLVSLRALKKILE